MDEQSRGSIDDLRNPEITSLVADRLNELRKRLLDFSRRNPLVNIHFKTNAIRVVDELPDIIRHNLTASRKMKLAPLPALEEELPDEGTDSFLDALHLARKEDEIYLAELSALDPDSTTYAEQELKAERAEGPAERGARPAAAPDEGRAVAHRACQGARDLAQLYPALSR